MVIVVMGVSGSGKTTIGRALANRLGWTFEDGDDWHSAGSVEKMRAGEPLSDEDRRPWIEALNRAMRGWVGAGCDVVLACSALRRWHREALGVGLDDPQALKFVYLRGTYEQVDQQLRRRTRHFMPEALLRSQFETLEAPGPTDAVIVQVGQPVARLVSTIVEALHLGSTPDDRDGPEES
jgi:gluconokinase